MPQDFPIFVGGAGRSGTTLAIDVIGLHPRISPVYETNFVIQIINLLYSDRRPPLEVAASQLIRGMDEWTKPLPLRPHNKREHERYHHGPHYVLFSRDFAMARTHELANAIREGDVDASVHAFVMALFNEHARLDGKPRWANKTPANVNHMPDLAKLFPEARFVHCVRDGRDVACSVLSRPWGPQTTGEAAVWWRDKVADGLRFKDENPDICYEVRYEDLITDPAPTLEAMFTWLGEEPGTETLLAAYNEGEVRLDPNRIGEWRRVFSEAQLREFDELAGSTLEHFGYERGF